MYCEFDTLEQAQSEINKIKYPGPCTQHWDIPQKTLQNKYICKYICNLNKPATSYKNEWFSNVGITIINESESKK
jgi:hypothetical protein